MREGVDTTINSLLLSVPANCEYIDMPGNYLPFTDTYLANVADIEACRDECNRQDRYNCRSFNYNSDRKECFLSAGQSLLPLPRASFSLSYGSHFFSELLVLLDPLIVWHQTSILCKDVNFFVPR